MKKEMPFKRKKLINKLISRKLGIIQRAGELGNARDEWIKYYNVKAKHTPDVEFYENSERKDTRKNFSII